MACVNWCPRHWLHLVTAIPATGGPSGRVPTWSLQPQLLSLPLAHACALPCLHRFSHHAHTWCCYKALVVVSLPCSRAAAPHSWLAKLCGHGTGSSGHDPESWSLSSRTAQDPQASLLLPTIAFILLSPTQGLGHWGLPCG